MIEKVRLGDICSVRGGYAFKSELFKSEGTPIIRIGNITKDGLIIDEDVCYDEKFWDENDSYRVEKNDILRGENPLPKLLFVKNNYLIKLLPVISLG